MFWNTNFFDILKILIELLKLSLQLFVLFAVFDFDFSWNIITDGKNEENVTTPTGSVGSAAEAIDELAGLTLEEQEKQRAEWSTVR